MTTTYTAFSPAKPAQDTLRLDHRSTNGYQFAPGYLRAFLTLLVLAHHAVLAYISFAPPPSRSLLAKPQLWLAFPVVDSYRWPGFDLLVAFNDVFFMSLMFFLSGLFVWNSLRRKGVNKFLHDRAVRLGIPFLVAVAVLAPLAYFPSYLMLGNQASLWTFGKQWLLLDHWPSGPAWFISMLLAFDCLVALLSMMMPTRSVSLSHLFSSVWQRPETAFGFIVAVSALAYIPMARAFSPISWTVFGPFTFQTSRLFHYAAYFLIAVALGAFGIERPLLARNGKLARHWLFWCMAAVGAFILQVAAALTAISAHTAVSMWATLAAFLFVLSCAASSFACLAFFARFAAKRVCWLDGLRDNAYGMYLVHYVFVSWLQYILLKTAFPAVSKGLLVFFGTLVLSWATTAALRRIPAVARTI